MKDLNEEKEICTFLERKLAHFKQYLSITEKMKQAFGNKEEINNLGKLISRRQGCVNNIERIDLSVGKILKKGSRKLSRISNKYKGMIDGYLLKIRDIMTTVDLMDKEIMVMVKQEGEGIKTEVLKTRNFRQAARGYRGSTGYTARFLDTRR
jgi:hypothetical protein